MYGFRGSALGFAAASWQWQPTPHDPSNVVELSDAAGGAAQTLTGTLYSDSDSFGAGVVSTSITLTGTLFTNSNSFGAGSIGTTITVTGALFTDSDSFGAGTVSQAGGTQTITGALFDDSADSFGAGVVSTSITITGTLFTDSDTFGAGTLSQTGPQTIIGTLFVDDDSFGVGTVTQTTVETPATGGGGGGGGWIRDSRTPARVERDRRRQWDKIEERQDEIRRLLLAAIEPVTTEQQLETVEQSDAQTITLAERVIKRPDILPPRDLLRIASLVQELKAAHAAAEAARQEEEDAIVLLLLAA